MRVTVPDDTLDPYVAQAQASGRTVDAVVALQLDRFRACPVGARAVVLSTTTLDALEPLLGGGQIRDGHDLRRKVERLAGIEFHKIRLDFTPGQLEELAHRASRQGKDVEVLAREIIREITEQFFWASGGGPASAAYVPPASACPPDQEPSRDTQSVDAVVDQVS